MESVLSAAHSEAARPQVAVFAALRREIDHLGRIVSVEGEAAQENCRIITATHGGLKVMLVQTGPGRDRAVQAASLAFDRFRPGVALCLGFAGALREELRAGDLVICQSLCHLGKDGGLSQPLDCDRSLVQLAMEACDAGRLPARSGSSLTVDEESGVTGTKARLGITTLGKVVDMEDYWVARQAEARGVPFLAVRAISDTVDQALPPWQDFVDGRGEVNGRRLLLYLLSHPGGVVPLVKLARSSQRAALKLGCFLAAFLSLCQKAREPSGDCASTGPHGEAKDQ